jgi:hypothetical protein
VLKSIAEHELLRDPSYVLVGPRHQRGMYHSLVVISSIQFKDQSGLLTVLLGLLHTLQILARFPKIGNQLLNAPDLAALQLCGCGSLLVPLELADALVEGVEERVGFGGNLRHLCPVIVGPCPVAIVCLRNQLPEELLCRGEGIMER